MRRLTVKEGLDSKEDIFRFPTMPTASEDNAGEIIQYTGATNANYIHGCFYECVEDNNTYSWQQIIGQSQDFTGTQAEWNALTTEQKALYEIVNITDDSTAPEVVDTVPTQNSTHLVQSGGVWTKTNRIDQNFGTVELSSVASYPHSVGETFINAAGQMVRCTAAIAVGDTITIGTNVSVTNIASALSELNSNISGLLHGGAGFHNSRYRGANLGNVVTTAQYAAIQAGTFDDMFIGDYWIINGVVWRIAAFDYWLHCGDTECTDHHVLLVPDTCLGENQKMNDSNVMTGGYVGSKMYTTYLNGAKTIIEGAFGSTHILTHRELLSNTVDSSGNASNWSWYDSNIELMNEQMVYGGPCGAKPTSGSIDFNMGIDKSQLPLFALEPSRICNRAGWWLRSVVSATHFASVSHDGVAALNNASDALGVRPVFAIH